MLIKKIKGIILIELYGVENMGIDTQKNYLSFSDFTFFSLNMQIMLNMLIGISPIWMSGGCCT